MAAEASGAFVRVTPVAAMPPPISDRGPLGWVRAHLLSSKLNIALTLLSLLVIWWIVPPLLNFLIFDATWSGSDRAACIATPERPRVGACWAFVWERINFFVYGFYPIPERWRVDVFFALLAFGIVWLLSPRAPFKKAGAIYFFIALPILSIVFLLGFAPLGLSYVSTSLWGGILVTIVVSAVGIVFSLPLGVILALGRRSKMPVVRLLSVVFIEFVRGVPLITVLFMASVMLPLFVPESWSPDKLLRALIGVALFAAAYMAEVVRAGLQSVPRGQF
ncbi:MAG: ABC transporter permease subunit, partial [Pseudorhodoplanes sp.]